MIVKSKTYKNSKCFTTVVDYILRDVEKNKSFVLTRFIKGEKTTESISKQLQLNEAFRLHRRSNNVKLEMTILSFHKDDAGKLDNDRLKRIAKKWITLRAPRAINIATVHRDKSHTHLHVLHGGVDRSGKSIRLSKQDFKSRKVSIENFVRKEFPDLEHSKIDHDKPSKKK